MIPRDSQSGITLLETMIGLVIMAMMAVMFSGFFDNGLRIFGRSGTLVTDLDHAVTRRNLRQWLENALTQMVPNDPRPVFNGQSDGFSALVLPVDGLFWPGAATQITLVGDGALTAKGETDKRTPLSLQARLQPEGGTIRVQYWGKRTTQATPSWYKEWPSGSALPILIKIEFSGAGRPLPPLTIHVAKAQFQSEMSLSSLVPPALPSRP